jgi:hypothetical protein
VRHRGLIEAGRPVAGRVSRGRTAAALSAVVAALALLIATGCGSSSPSGSGASSAPGLVIAGPGLQTSQPPWKPEYAHLAERKAELHLPPVGNEEFHIHAALHIYVNGLLKPVPALVGLEPAKGIETSLHTHDSSGVIHMETVHPFKFTLGEFFKVWGVKLGPEQVGGLKGLGGDKLHFYVNGHKLTNPAVYVMRNGDNFAIGYGPESSFPHSPGTQLLHEVMEGKAGLNCSATTSSTKGKGCMVKIKEAAQKDKPKK